MEVLENVWLILIIIRIKIPQRLILIITFYISEEKKENSHTKSENPESVKNTRKKLMLLSKKWAFGDIFGSNSAFFIDL